MNKESGKMKALWNSLGSGGKLIAGASGGLLGLGLLGMATKGKKSNELIEDEADKVYKKRTEMKSDRAEAFGQLGVK